MLEGVSERLIEAGLQIHEAPCPIVLSQLRLALAGYADVDHLDREAALTQMQPEIMADAAFRRSRSGLRKGESSSFLSGMRWCITTRFGTRRRLQNWRLPMFLNCRRQGRRCGWESTTSFSTRTTD